jgi:hypothetical protein
VGGKGGDAVNAITFIAGFLAGLLVGIASMTAFMAYLIFGWGKR